MKKPTHRAIQKEKTRRLKIAIVIKILKSEFDCSDDYAWDYLTTLVEQFGLKLLEQGRPVPITSAIAALISAQRDGLERAVVEFWIPHQNRNVCLKRKLSTCTIDRDSMGDALARRGDIIGLTNWPGLEDLTLRTPALLEGAQFSPPPSKREMGIEATQRRNEDIILAAVEICIKVYS